MNLFDQRRFATAFPCPTPSPAMVASDLLPSTQACRRDDGAAAWANTLPDAEGRELAGLMNSLAGNDPDAYEEALPLVAHRLGLGADDLDARCRALLRADRAMWRGLLILPFILGGAALSLAAAAGFLFAAD